MFEKFGEFNTVEELNKAAEGLKAEGDIASLKILAEENGIEIEDAEDYMDGAVEEFATVTMAAYGRITAQEKSEINTVKNPMEKMALNLIVTMLKGMCTTDEEIAAAVMKKGKRISNILKEIENEAKKHKTGNMGMSCGTDRQLCEIIKSYYLESSAQLKSRIENLYK